MSDATDDNEFGYDSVDYNSHPSLSLALIEARNRYRDEEDRRRTVETKIGILISIDAIVISIVASLGGIEERLAILIIALALGSAAVGLYILWPRNYHRPGVNDINEIFGEAQREESDFEKQFLNDYRAAVVANIEKNNDRYWYFKTCAVLTFTSIGVIFISQIPISQVCGLLS